MKTKIKNLTIWMMNFGKGVYRFWFETTICEERMRELRSEHLKYYYFPTIRM